ncbi:MAG: nicotinate-nicotinamide nucleotide adenylyltransferase [Erysipelotrichaceae bacterium]|nr:nicotinate-nicotinamide nucleotide adenylyltransferase [Erysipelotrichaceae bacterium]
MIRALACGGAFNPPTRAHIELADYARQYLGFDKVIFIPSKMSYITEEQGKDFAFDNETRLGMLRKIAGNRDWMEVTDYEIRADHQPRTYETLCFLKEQGYEVRLLFGSDKLPELEHGWRHIPELCREFGIAVMSRNNEDVHALIDRDPYLSGLKEFISVIPTPDTYQDVSSTKVRQQIALYRQARKYIVRTLPEELGDLSEYINEE